MEWEFLNAYTVIGKNEVNPYVRMASKHYIERGFNTGTRINRHYQLHYVCGGKGHFGFEEEICHASEGDFYLWGPGIRHFIESDSKDPLEVIGVQYDVTWNYSHLEYPCIHYNEETFSDTLIQEHVRIEGSEETSYRHLLNEPHRIKYYMEEVVRLFRLKTPFHKEIISGMMKAVLLLVMENDTFGSAESGKDNTAIEEIVAYLSDNYRCPMSNREVGDRFGYHSNYLNHVMQNYTGKTIQQYLIDLRMNKAIDLLQHTNRSVGDIADEVGGYSIHYFSRLFKQKVGVSPSHFRS